ncbi:hypothetical protein D3C87_1693310 [compost metagenome]
MRMCIRQSRNNCASGGINDLCLVGFQFHDLVVLADFHESAVLYGKSFLKAVGMRKDLGVIDDQIRGGARG